MKKKICSLLILGMTISSQSYAFKFKDFVKDLGNQVVGQTVTRNQPLPPTRFYFQSTDPTVCEQQAKSRAEQQAVMDCSTQTHTTCKVLSSSISRPAVKELANNGPFESYDSGSDDNPAVAEQKAKANAERTAITECVKKTSQQCVIFSPGYVSQGASENPARSIGGLNVPRYDARAGASAKPAANNQDTYSCEATAIAQPKMF